MLLIVEGAFVEGVAVVVAVVVVEGVDVVVLLVGVGTGVALDAATLLPAVHGPNGRLHLVVVIVIIIGARVQLVDLLNLAPIAPADAPSVASPVGHARVLLFRVDLLHILVQVALLLVPLPALARGDLPVGVLGYYYGFVLLGLFLVGGQLLGYDVGEHVCVGQLLLAGSLLDGLLLRLDYHYVLQVLHFPLVIILQSDVLGLLL